MKYRNPRVAVLDDEATLCPALASLRGTCWLKVEVFSTGAPFLSAAGLENQNCTLRNLRRPGITERTLSPGAREFLIKPLYETALIGACPVTPGSLTPGRESISISAINQLN
jgi:hypothetical protein